MSQNSDLGLRFHFMKCRSLHSRKCQKVTRFFKSNKNEDINKRSETLFPQG